MKIAVAAANGKAGKLIVEEAVNRILSKRDRRRMQVHLHEEGPVAEDHGKE